jgi:hypothetical protein
MSEQSVSMWQTPYRDCFAWHVELNVTLSKYFDCIARSIENHIISQKYLELDRIALEEARSVLHG